MSEIIRNFKDLDLNCQYTYGDYLNWRFDERVELIKGWIHKMSPAPKRIHQSVLGKLHNQVFEYYNVHECFLYMAPFDVVLLKKDESQNESNTVVQPDLFVVCDKSKLTEQGCTGAPDLIVEIISGSTAKKDYNEKFNLYEQNGVKEYWLVDPRVETVETFVLEDNAYQRHIEIEKGEGIITSPLFPDLKIDCQKIFVEPF